jgi:hypothetical protein
MTGHLILWGRLALAGLLSAAALVILTLGLAARLQTHNPIMSGEYPEFSTCALPCWAGVEPLRTQTADVALLMTTHLPHLTIEFRRIVTQLHFTARGPQGDFAGVIYDNRGQVSGMRLEVSLPLWPLLATLEQPRCARALRGPDGQAIAALSWETADHVINATVFLNQQEKLQPDAQVRLLSIFERYRACDAPGERPWRGFGPIWLYTP